MRSATKRYQKEREANELWRKNARDSHARIVEKFGKRMNK